MEKYNNKKKLKIQNYNLNKKNIFLHLVLVLSTYFTFLITVLFYNSAQSPDYGKYRSYLDYYLGSANSSNLEQGNLYFYIVSQFINFGSHDINLRTIEEYISYKIQFANFFFYIVFITGLYRVLKIYKFRKDNILLLLIVLNFFPPLVAIRIIFKPEILILGLITFCILFIEKYLKTKKLEYIVSFVLFYSLIISTKFTSASMVTILFFIIYRRKFLNDFSNIVLATLIITLFLFGILSYENYLINDIPFFEGQNPDFYNSKASSNFIYNVNFKDLVYKPYKDFHADSMIGIILLETFDDYFHLYWNNDESLFSKAQIPTNIKYVPYLGMSMTLIFYILIIYLSIVDKRYRPFYLSPFIGIFIMYLISNFIIFNSNTGDMMKNYYYSFFLVISFSFVLMYLFTKFQRFKIILCVIFICCSIFIFGFPKNIDNSFESRIIDNNIVTLGCNLNSIMLNLDNKGCSLELNKSCDDIFTTYKKTEIINGEFREIYTESVTSYQISKNKSFKTIFNLEECKKLINDGWIFKDPYVSTKNPPLINLLIYFFPFLLFSYKNIKNKIRM